MKINGMELFWIVFVVCLFMFLTFTYYIDQKETKIALQNGYCQKVIDHKTIWVKCESK